MIYGEESWYRERPEKEQSWQGVLGRREVTLGPGARTALRYTLVTARESLPVYDPDGRERLKVLVGRRVVAHGKRVDLSREGFGPELWIGSIEPADSSAGKGGR